jgi:predicted transcriptional regulator
VSSISPGDIPVTFVMTKTVRTVTPDLPVDELSRVFLEESISGAPVVDPDGRPIGMVSKTDLIRARCSGALVDDIMTAQAIALPEDATVTQAAAVMACERIHRVLVVSNEGRIVGVVSALDVLRWMAFADGFIVARPAKGGAS